MPFRHIFMLHHFEEDDEETCKCASTIKPQVSHVQPFTATGTMPKPPGMGSAPRSSGFSGSTEGPSLAGILDTLRSSAAQAGHRHLCTTGRKDHPADMAASSVGTCRLQLDQHPMGSGCMLITPAFEMLEVLHQLFWEGAPIFGDTPNPWRVAATATVNNPLVLQA